MMLSVPLWYDQTSPLVLDGVVLVQVSKGVLLVRLAIKVLTPKQEDLTLHSDAYKHYEPNNVKAVKLSSSASSSRAGFRWLMHLACLR